MLTPAQRIMLLEGKPTTDVVLSLAFQVLVLHGVVDMVQGLHTRMVPAASNTSCPQYHLPNTYTASAFAASPTGPALTVLVTHDCYG